MSKYKTPTKVQQPKQKRTHNVSISFNDREIAAIEIYCEKYNVKKRGCFLRETIIRAIMSRFLEDYPTLFEKEEMNSLMVEQEYYSLFP